MYSQGINDALAGTPVATWTTATQNYFATQLRPLVGANSLIIMSKFSAAYATYNAAMDNIAAVDPLTKTIFGDDGLWQGDGAHRTYAGYRQWAEEYMDAWLLPSGQSPVPATAPAGGSGFGTGTVTVTITPAQGEDVYYSTDGSDPLTAAKKYTGPFTVTAPATVKARGVLFNKASSTIVTNAYGS
jgi:hypothetical protein